MYASDVPMQARPDGPLAAPRHVVRSRANDSNPTASPGAQLRSWIALLLREFGHGPVPVALSQGYCDADGRRCTEEDPPPLRFASRLARFERRRRALVEFDQRIRHHTSEDRERRARPAEREHLVKTLYESRARLRDEAWVLGVHYHQTGIRPDQITITLVAAVDRALQLVAVADHEVVFALLRDLVRRGLQGYHAAVGEVGTAIAEERSPKR